jgi:hygromycin-B 7''-O-kinase
MQLPQDITPTEFDQSYKLQTHLWIDAVSEILALNFIAEANLETFKDGSNLLAADQKLVVKIFPPFHRNQWESERRVLRHLQQSNITVPIPALIADGERTDGWPYLILSRLPGITLESVWKDCSEEKMRNFCETLAASWQKCIQYRCATLVIWSHFGRRS